MQILKCSECGNTFRSSTVKERDIVTCTTCEANYKVQIKDGKIRLETYIHEEEDSEELLRSPKLEG